MSLGPIIVPSSAGVVLPNRRLVLQPPASAVGAYDSSDYGCPIYAEGTASLSSTTPVSGTKTLSVAGSGNSFIGINPGKTSTPTTHFEIGAGTSAFIELFVYFATLPGASTHIFGGNDLNFCEIFVGNASNQLAWYRSGGRLTSFYFSTATWAWIVLDIRNSSGNTVCYANGSSVDSVASDTNAYTLSGTALNVGDQWSAVGHATMLFQGRLHIGENHPNPTGSAPTTPWSVPDLVA